jgi:hypothetical protein
MDYPWLQGGHMEAGRYAIKMCAAAAKGVPPRAARRLNGRNGIEVDF